MKLKSIINNICIAALIAFTAGCGTGNITAGSDGSTPAVPSRLTATQGTLEDSVLIEWDAVKDAEYYIIYKALETPEEFKLIASRVTGLSFSDTPVSSNRIFYYRVAAGNGTKWSAPGIEVKGFALKGAPMPPSEVSEPESGIGRISITWETVINAVSYNIYRSHAKYGTYTMINTEPVAGNTYIDTDAAADKKYYYKIVAVNSYGEGASGEIISGIALENAPVWPETVSLTATDAVYGEKVKLQWTAADYAASYTVYRAPANGGTAGEYAVIAEDITSLVYEDRDTTLEDMTDYYYRIAAVSSGGITDSGMEAAGSVNRAIPAEINPPTVVKASKGKTNVITVSWTEVDGCNGGYSVYRSASDTFSSPVKIADKITPAVVDGYHSFDDSGFAPLPDKATYYYKVTAWSASGENQMESGMNLNAAEGYANPDLPGVPANVVTAADYTGKTLTVSWSAPDTWTRTYSVYRSDNGIDGDYNLVSLNQTGLSFTESIAAEGGEIQGGHEYFYKIRGCNDIGFGAYSSGTSARYLLKVPGNLAASKVYNWDAALTYTYTVTWSTVSAASGYEVMWGSNVIQVAGGNTTTVTFKTGNYPASSYKIKIRAVNTFDLEGTPVTYYSPYSAEVTK
jgi:fibronectin type 3 domain-containing protein